MKNQLNAKMMKLLMFFVVVFSITGCKDHMFEQENKLPLADKVADRITADFARKMFNKKGLVMIGEGGGGGGGKIRILSITFHNFQKLDLMNARKLLLECVDEFLSEINKNHDLEPFSWQFPYTYKNVDIDILFIDKQRQEFVSPPAIAAAGIENGMLDFNIHEESLQTVREETYEESVKLAAEEHL